MTAQAPPPIRVQNPYTGDYLLAQAEPVPSRNPVFLGLFNAIAFLTIFVCVVQAWVRWEIDGWFMPAILAAAFILVTTDWDR